MLRICPTSPTRRSQRYLCVSALICGSIFLSAGCGSSKRAQANTKLNEWLVTQNAALPQLDYKVNSPDVLVIVAPKIKELDGRDAFVRSDGKISLPLVGELFVAGKTPAEISRELRSALRKFYSNDVLDVSVAVSEYKSKNVFVFGEVDEPGIKPYTGKDTLVHVLAEARLNDNAWPQRIVIVRPHEDPNIRQRITVDLKEMYQTGQLARNYLLEEGDVIYVPPSPLAELNAKTDKIVDPLIPAISVFSFLRPAP